MQHSGTRCSQTVSVSEERVAGAQLADLAQALDVVALEVERLSEGQRFTARLLAERSSSSRAADVVRPQGVITPH